MCEYDEVKNLYCWLIVNVADLKLNVICYIYVLCYFFLSKI